ncbi:hypothetical protein YASMINEVIRUS_1072 [Yasminevirus sp. GU-2018]|uniref:Uncharacterized protein n=1 Tax=Yasminevirus sp. GU-2018 TaxID=2420051 RepID=A0A5K0U8X7_9VIRU|nr:hypothetical protein YASMINEVIRUS_1072 [Yasminevirus sp. GU-2018]
MSVLNDDITAHIEKDLVTDPTADLITEIMKTGPRRCVYPTIMNNVLDLTDLNSDVLIDHKLDVNDPSNLIIVSRNDRSDITVFLRADYLPSNLITSTNIKNTDQTKQISTKRYNNFPFIINTTSVKLVLLNYNMEFLIEQDNKTKSDTILISSSILCNNLHSIYNSTFTVKTTSSGVDKHLRIVRQTDVINASFEEIYHANRQYIPSIHNVTKEKSRRTSRIREGVLDIISDYTDETEVVAFIDLLRYKSLLECENLKRGKTYRIINFNGFFVDYCSDGMYQCNFLIKCDISLQGRFFNGVVGGYVATLKGVELTVNGDVDVSTTRKSYFSGLMTGVSRWIDDVTTKINGDVNLSGSIVGIISGTSSGVYNTVECIVRDKICLKNVLVFGTVVGYLTPVPIDHLDSSDKKTHIEQKDDQIKKLLKIQSTKSTDKFSFKLVLNVDGSLRSSLVSNSNTRYGVLGNFDEMFAKNENSNVSDSSDATDNFDNSDKNSKSTDNDNIDNTDDSDGKGYVFDDDDVEGIYENTKPNTKSNPTLNLNRHDDRSRSSIFSKNSASEQNVCKKLDINSQFDDVLNKVTKSKTTLTKTHQLVINTPNIKTVNKNKVTTPNHNNSSNSNFSHINHVMGFADCQDGVCNTQSNTTFNRHTTSWSMFNMIKDMRLNTGSTLKDFPKSSECKMDKKKHSKKTQRMSNKKDTMESKTEMISKLMNDHDEHDDLNNFDETSSSMYETNYRQSGDNSSGLGSLRYNSTDVLKGGNQSDLTIKVKISHLSDADETTLSEDEEKINNHAPSIHGVNITNKPHTANPNLVRVVDTSDIFDTRYQVQTKKASR